VIALLLTFGWRGPAKLGPAAPVAGYAAPIPPGSIPGGLVTPLRALRLIMLSGLVFVVWYETNFPWDEGCRTYVWLNVALGALLLTRMVGWPSYLWLAFLAWFLAGGVNQPRS
jgi:hypothetical protein